MLKDHLSLNNDNILIDTDIVIAKGKNIDVLLIISESVTMNYLNVQTKYYKSKEKRSSVRIYRK